MKIRGVWQCSKYTCINCLNSFLIKDRATKVEARIGISLEIRIQKICARELIFLKGFFEETPASLLLLEWAGKEF